jgi:predicted O-methyltransferase YrrM
LSILKGVTVRGNTAYEGIKHLPPLVRSAVAVASSQGFDHSCAPEQGRLLSVLARGYVGCRVGETGTGCGVGLAWMVDATDTATSFVSVEIDATRAEASSGLFAGEPNIRIIIADWRQLRSFGPFDLLVLDGGGKGKEPGDDPPLDPADGWLAVGGTIVLGDFTPGENAHDEARRYWLNHPALHATEVLLTPTLSTVVARRTR